LPVLQCYRPVVVLAVFGSGSAVYRVVPQSLGRRGAQRQ